jgi:hypothetical protein
MKMKKIAYAIAALGISTFAAGSAMAGASAKFAATYTTEPWLSSVVVTGDGTEAAYVEFADKDISKYGHTLATIKVPQDKELLVGVSAEIGLVTYGSIKGKNGGSATAKADAEAYVTIFAVPTDTYSGSGIPTDKARPGTIMLSKRIQELSATLGGVIEDCTFNTSGDAEEITINIATDCTVSDEEIGLLQATTAAHHFNFVLPNMDQGEYDIVALFTTGAAVEVNVCDADSGCTDGVGEALAAAKAAAVINKTMLTVQEVRATKDGIVDATFIVTETTNSN